MAELLPIIVYLFTMNFKRSEIGVERSVLITDMLILSLIYLNLSFDSFNLALHNLAKMILAAIIFSCSLSF